MPERPEEALKVREVLPSGILNKELSFLLCDMVTLLFLIHHNYSLMKRRMVTIQPTNLTPLPTAIEKKLCVLGESQKPEVLKA